MFTHKKRYVWSIYIIFIRMFMRKYFMHMKENTFHTYEHSVGHYLNFSHLIWAHFESFVQCTVNRFHQTSNVVTIAIPTFSKMPFSARRWSDPAIDFWSHKDYFLRLTGNLHVWLSKSDQWSFDAWSYQCLNLSDVWMTFDENSWRVLST